MKTICAGCLTTITPDDGYHLGPTIYGICETCAALLSFAPRTRFSPSPPLHFPAVGPPGGWLLFTWAVLLAGCAVFWWLVFLAAGQLWDWAVGP